MGSSNSRHAPDADISSRIAHSQRAGPNSGFHCTLTKSAQSSLSSRRSALTTKLSANQRNGLDAIHLKTGEGFARIIALHEVVRLDFD